jgi:hypothetical protein
MTRPSLPSALAAASTMVFCKSVINAEGTDDIAVFLEDPLSSATQGPL